MDLPALPARRRIAGSVWAVLMVKNEIDVVERTIRHLLNQGVDGVLVADNGSTDGTLERLQHLAREDARVFVGLDREPAYYQAAKMDYLARAAARAGADWITPVDADELWFGGEGRLVDALRSASGSIAVAEIHNAFPNSSSSEQDLWRIDVQPARLQKVAFRFARLARLHHGNHAVDRLGQPRRLLYILHLPWRSREQFVRKVRAGARALTLAKGAQGVSGGDHWRDLNALTEDQLNDAWLALIDGHGDERMEWRPVGKLVPVRSLSVSEWAELLPQANEPSSGEGRQPMLGEVSMSNVRIYTRSMSDQLYWKAASFMPDESVIPRTRVLGSTALGFLLDAIADPSADIVVSIDEDAYLTDPDRLFALIDRVRSDGVALCGMPDGGVCPHRYFNPRSINPFFAIINSAMIRESIASREFEGQDVESTGLLDGHPRNLLRHRYQLGEHEPFDQLLVWIAENYPTLYLDASEHADGLTTVLQDPDSNPFLLHTWFTREYMRDPFHTRRINAIISEAHALNPSGEGISRWERLVTERKLLEYNLARRIYIRLKTRYKLV